MARFPPPPYINSTPKNANSQTFLLRKSSTLGSFSCRCCHKVAFCHEARGDAFFQMQKTNIARSCRGQKNSEGTRQRHLFTPADKAARPPLDNEGQGSQERQQNVRLIFEQKRHCAKRFSGILINHQPRRPPNDRRYFANQFPSIPV